MRILYVHNAPTRFVKIDLELLRQNYQLTEYYLSSPRFNPVDIATAVAKHDVVMGWFASWHTVLPVLLARLAKKPSILMVGGYDTANVPQASYGSQRGGLRRLVANVTMKKASCLVANSESTRDEVIRHVGVAGEKITVIYHGMPAIAAGNIVHRQKLVLTVGGVKQENLLRKGLLPFVLSAAYLPDVNFIQVGRWFDDSINSLKDAAGTNVEFTGFVADEELEDLYARSAVYVQASLHEGFGMSVAEAMLAGCIPVVTRNGSLPEVVGDTGVYCASNEPTELATAIRQALTMNGNARVKTRERVINKFSLEKREKSLVRLINQVMH